MPDVDARELSDRVWSVAEACLQLAKQDGAVVKVHEAAEHLLNALDLLAGGDPNAWREELVAVG